MFRVTPLSYIKTSLTSSLEIGTPNEASNFSMNKLDAFQLDAFYVQERIKLVSSVTEKLVFTMKSLYGKCCTLSIASTCQRINISWLTERIVNLLLNTHIKK